MALDFDDDVRAMWVTACWPFRRAVTVPDFPHEYCLRRWLTAEQEAEFDWFAGLIAEHGYEGWFWRQRWVYLALGDGWKYWMSREVYGDGAVVNKARVEEPAQMRMEGL